MSADIVSLEDWRETRNSKAALARWALRLRKQIEANMKSASSRPSAKPSDFSGDAA